MALGWQPAHQHRQQVTRQVCPGRPYAFNLCSMMSPLRFSQLLHCLSFTNNIMSPHPKLTLYLPASHLLHAVPSAWGSVPFHICFQPWRSLSKMPHKHHCLNKAFQKTGQTLQLLPLVSHSTRKLPRPGSVSKAQQVWGIKLNCFAFGLQNKV